MRQLTNRNAAWITAAALLALAFIAAAASWQRIAHNPDIPFLVKDPKAQWILYPHPPDPNLHPAFPLVAIFRRSFTLPSVPAQLTLSYRSFRDAGISINGRPIPLPPAHENWKTIASIDASSFLRAGQNELVAAVTNSLGPPSLWLCLESPAQAIIATDQNWEAALADASWQKAVPARNQVEIRPGNYFFGRELMSGSLKRSWPALLIILAAVSCAVLLLAPRAKQLPAFQKFLTPTAAVALISCAWITLFANNLPKMAPLFGFDRDGHLEYVDYILKHQRLPLADEGWQMYQPPLFYLVSALALSPFGSNPFDDSAVTGLRALNALIGLANALFTCLALRLLFASRPWLPVLGMFLATLLPMNLCLSHHITNEMLSGLLVTVSLYFTLRIVRSKGSPPILSLAVGFSLGLALLTKFSAIIAVPAILAALAWHFWRQHQTSRGVYLLGIVLATLLLVSGWHYLRVWNKFGNPLIGNWDPSLPFKWWQEPGYRTSDWYRQFGSSMTCPLFSGFHSFGDGLYSTFWGDGLGSGSARVSFRPPWNYDLMNCAYIAAIPLAALLLYGLFATLFRLLRNPDTELLLMLGLVFAFALGVAYMTLQVPSYAQVKAFYAMPALLPICALAIATCHRLANNSKPLKQILAIILLTWGVLVYSSFWIRSGNPSTFSSRGTSFSSTRQYAEAQKQFSRALSLDPSCLPAQLGLAETAINLGDSAAAARILESILANHPDSAEANRLLGINTLSTGTNSPKALELLSRAAALAPDHPLVHEQLAKSLLQLHRLKDAVEACQNGLRVDPFNPRIHFIWATACLERNDLSNVVVHLDTALRLKPDWVEVGATLSLALATLGRLTEAAVQYSKTIALKPTDPYLHYQFALVLMQQGDSSKASEEYRRALDLNPDLVEALNNLAWMRAAASKAEFRNGTEAVTLAERACQLTQFSQPVLLGTLAAAYAEAGRFQDAVATAEKAVQIARELGNTALTQKNLDLLNLYRNGKPYHEAAP